MLLSDDGKTVAADDVEVGSCVRLDGVDVGDGGESCLRSIGGLALAASRFEGGGDVGEVSAMFPTCAVSAASGPAS